MKRCPECEFVYEDDQSLCDMDGSELVHDAHSLPLPVLADVTGDVAEVKPVRQPPRGRNLGVAVVVGVILTGLLAVAYYALKHRPQSNNTNRALSAVAVAPKPSPSSFLLSPPGPTVDPSPAASTYANLGRPAPSKTASRPARLSSGPVSAAGSSERSRGPVTIRLTNGAIIKADEAWEKSEGIWYRQGSVVTLLKRNRARAIERSKPPPPTVSKSQEKKAEPETAPVKKESRVNSILRKTGRILKRPFRF